MVRCSTSSCANSLARRTRPRPTASACAACPKSPPARWVPSGSRLPRSCCRCTSAFSTSSVCSTNRWRDSWSRSAWNSRSGTPRRRWRPPWRRQRPRAWWGPISSACTACCCGTSRCRCRSSSRCRSSAPRYSWHRLKPGHGHRRRHRPAASSPPPATPPHPPPRPLVSPRLVVASSPGPSPRPPAPA